MFLAELQIKGSTVELGFWKKQGFASHGKRQHGAALPQIFWVQTSRRLTSISLGENGCDDKSCASSHHVSSLLRTGVLAAGY